MNLLRGKCCPITKRGCVRWRAKRANRILPGAGLLLAVVLFLLGSTAGAGACDPAAPDDCDDADDCTLDVCKPFREDCAPYEPPYVCTVNRCTHINTCGMADSAIVGVGHVCVYVNTSDPSWPIAGAAYFDDITFDVMGSMVNLSTVSPVSFTGIAAPSPHFSLTAAAPNPGDFQYATTSGDVSSQCLVGGGGLCFISDLSNVASAAFPVLETVALTSDGHLSGGYSCEPTPPGFSLQYSGPLAINAFRKVPTSSGTDVTINVEELYFDSRLQTTDVRKASVRFAEVLSDGDTRIRLMSNAAAQVSATLAIPGVVPFIDVSTTAVWEGVITICADYPDSDDNGIVDGTDINEADLRFLHRENDVFVDLTLSLDAVNNVICGETSSLSQFAVGTEERMNAMPCLKACQKAIAKAGLQYASSRLKAIQRCRDKLNRGESLFFTWMGQAQPLHDPNACENEVEARGRIGKAANDASRRVYRACQGPEECRDGLSYPSGACAGTLSGLVVYLSGSGWSGCLITTHAAAVDTCVGDQYGRLILPEEKELRSCQRAIAKAGSGYLVTRLKAIQRCRDRLKRGELVFFDAARTQPLNDPSGCENEFKTARGMRKSGQIARQRVQKSCSDELLSSLASACATTVDGLVNSTGDGGCLIAGHAAAVDALIEAQY
jgi:hypothetical protein